MRLLLATAFALSFALPALAEPSPSPRPLPIRNVTVDVQPNANEAAPEGSSFHIERPPLPRQYRAIAPKALPTPSPSARP